MIEIFIFLFGLTVGSFLNSIIYRLEISSPRGKIFPKGLLKDRSCCPNCQHILSWRDLIPLLSFFLLKGRCRYCQQRISWQYPLVEVFTAILFLSIFIFFFLKTPYLNFAIAILTTSFYFLITCFLIIIFVYDLKHYIIPDKLIYPAIAIVLIYNFLKISYPEGRIFGFDNFSTSNQFSIFSALGASAFFLLIVLLSRGRWMGMGDVKLAGLMGLVLGFPKILVALFSAFFLGAIIGIGWILAGKKTLKSQVPFGPFLVSGTFIAIFWGQQLINWYLGLFQII